MIKFNILNNKDILNYNKMESVSLEAFKRKVRGLADLYDITVRNGYFLPKETSTIVTEKYLRSVISKELYCPNYNDIRLRPCLSPPTKKIQIKKLEDVEK